VIIRRIPAALHLCYLGAGRFDAGVLVGTRLWDIAAGWREKLRSGSIVGRSIPTVTFGCGAQVSRTQMS